MKVKLSVLFVLTLMALLMVVGCRDNEVRTSENKEKPAGEALKADESAEAEENVQTEEAKSEEQVMEGVPVIIFETTMGNFEVALDPEKAPVSVNNFLSYVNEGFFDGLIFHRVIGNFMIQGGGFDKDMNKKTTKPPIKNEAGNGLLNKKYTIAMARTNDVNSATSQFFINVVDNSFLDHRDETPGGFGYAVFGKVISGFDVVDKIKAVPTTTKGMYQDVPVEPVVMNKVYLKR